MVELRLSADFCGDKWDVQIIVQCTVRNEPRCISYRPEYFGLQSLDDLRVGRFGAPPELYTVSPHRTIHNPIK